MGVGFDGRGRLEWNRWDWEPVGLHFLISARTVRGFSAGGGQSLFQLVNLPGEARHFMFFSFTQFRRGPALRLIGDAGAS